MSNQEDAETVPSAAALSVVGHEYLLEEILVSLPAKSLGRFKVVSKQWRSLISNPKLIRRKSPTGMFLCSQKVSSLPLQVMDTKFVPFDALDKTRIPSLEFLKNRRFNNDNIDYDIEIRQSCHGLLLCLVITKEPFPKMSNRYHYNYVVCNPTTKQFRLLETSFCGNKTTPDPDCEVFLAFDPSISTHYKFITLRGNSVLIYFSEDKDWKQLRLPFIMLREWDCGWFYLNRAIYWLYVDKEEEEYGILHFDENAEKITKVPASPPARKDYFWGFVNDRGSRLHYAVKDKCSANDFGIVELTIDTLGSSKWVTKNKVCVSTLIRAYPQVAAAAAKEEEEEKMCWAPDLLCRALCVVEGPKEEGSALVLAIPGKVISYNFINKTVNELCDLPGDVAEYRNFQAFPYTESLFSV